MTNTKILSTILLSATLLSSSSSIAAEPKGKLYGDWKHTCEKLKDSKKTHCNIQQVISNKQDDKEVPIASYQFSYTDKKELKLLELLPHGILIQPGSSLIADKELLASGKFTFCQPAGCVAIADVSQGDLVNIYKAAEVSVVVMNTEGQQTGFPFSTKGLKEALAALK